MYDIKITGEPPRRGGSERPLAGCSEGETSPFSKPKSINEAIKEVEAIDVIRMIPADFDVFAED